MKDFDTLIEMHELTQSLLNDAYDITKVQMLDKLVEDWLDEFKGL